MSWEKEIDELHAREVTCGRGNVALVVRAFSAAGEKRVSFDRFPGAAPFDRQT